MTVKVPVITVHNRSHFIAEAQVEGGAKLIRTDCGMCFVVDTAFETSKREAVCRDCLECGGINRFRQRVSPPAPTHLRTLVNDDGEPLAKTRGDGNLQLLIC